MTVGSSIRQLHDFGRLPRVVLGSRGSSQAGSSSRLGSAALPAPSIGIRCRRPEKIDHGRAETHRCRAICDSNAARRRSTERPRTRLASQQLYARLERRECFSTLWTGATPRSGVGPAKTGVGCCLVMPAVHRPALCLAQHFVREARIERCEFSHHRAFPPATRRATAIRRVRSHDCLRFVVSWRRVGAQLSIAAAVAVAMIEQQR